MSHDSPRTPIRHHVLVVDDDLMVRALVARALELQGLAVTTAESGAHALHYLETSDIDLVISDLAMPGMDGFALVSKMRMSPSTRGTPVIFLTARANPVDWSTGLHLTVGDFISKPFDVDDLVARVLSTLAAGRESVDRLIAESGTDWLPTAAFSARVEQARRDLPSPPVVAVIDVAERAVLHARFGAYADHDLIARLAATVEAEGNSASSIGVDDKGRLCVMLTGLTPARTTKRLAALGKRIASERYSVSGEHVTVTPNIGWASTDDQTVSAVQVIRRASVAAQLASGQLDLLPVGWTRAMEPSAAHEQAPARERARGSVGRFHTPVQIAATYLIGLGVPLALYFALYFMGIDLTTWFYVSIVLAMVMTSFFIWAEGFEALDPARPPAEPSSPPPPATAIIAAYLPNEASTIVATVEAFLRVDYPELQVILAYNTPRGFLVERTLREMAARDPRFFPMRVEGSESKSQNVNAALRIATGEFTGIFDADHHPDAGSFQRAWRWLSNGYDVVQGHCVIRNGGASWVARTVAVEFEGIYAVAHPGRARQHGFGIFGGSNGFWRTAVLKATRMRSGMLTEDIDSSMRLVTSGGKIASDPALISRELAPTTAAQLWHQRLRWAQGWFQVTIKHLQPALRSKHLTARQKFGMVWLLGWREVYPWVSMQMFPLIAFLAWREGGLDHLNWLIVLFIVTTTFTASAGPARVLFARRLAVPEVRRRTSWFWWYFIIESVAYSEWKNLAARVAQVKELTGERQWKVTPRRVAARSEK